MKPSHNKHVNALVTQFDAFVLGIKLKFMHYICVSKEMFDHEAG